MARDQMKGLEAQIERFWTWVDEYEMDLVSETDEPAVMSTLVIRLGELAEGLMGELTTDSEGQKWLIISANGRKALLPLVMKIVEAAPKMETLQVRGFRPRKNGHVALILRGKRLASNDMFFTSRKRNKKLELTVYGPGLTQDEVSMMAVRLLLDYVVGEYEAATKIGNIEVREMKFEKKKKKGLTPFIHLPRMVDEMVGEGVN